MRWLWNYHFNKVECSHIRICLATPQLLPLSLRRHKIQIYPDRHTFLHRSLPSPERSAGTPHGDRRKVTMRLSLSSHLKLVSAIAMFLSHHDTSPSSVRPLDLVARSKNHRARFMLAWLVMTCSGWAAAGTMGGDEVSLLHGDVEVLPPKCRSSSVACWFGLEADLKGRKT